MYEIRVTNRQQYAIGRAGHIFPPGRTVEVKVNSERKVREVRACVYLAVEVLKEPIKAKPQMPEHVTKEVSLSELKVDDLRTIAKHLNIEGYSNLKKAELVEILSQEVEGSVDVETIVEEVETTVEVENDDTNEGESESEGEDAE